MTSSSERKVIFRQLFDTAGSSTYTYLLADPETREAVLIDPVLEMVDRDLQVVDELGLELVYLINSHCHADHITGSGEIKTKLADKKRVPQSVIAEAAGAKADVLVQSGHIIKCGGIELEARATPGHTDGCMTYVTKANGGMAFTGDALLIRGCGRTDFQGGDAGKLYDSVHAQILSLPGEYAVYPAHDYKGRSVSSVSEERRLNPRLTLQRRAFIDLMKGLGLPYPKKIDVSLPRNLVCGYNE